MSCTAFTNRIFLKELPEEESDLKEEATDAVCMASALAIVSSVVVAVAALGLTLSKAMTCYSYIIIIIAYTTYTSISCIALFCAGRLSYYCFITMLASLSIFFV